MPTTPARLALAVNEAVHEAARDQALLALERCDARYPTQRRVRLFTQRSDGPPRYVTDCLMLDLSNSGARLLCGRAFAQGRTLLIDLATPGKPVVLIHVLVRRHARLIPRAYEMGVEFLYSMGGVYPDGRPAGEQDHSPATPAGRCPHCGQPLDDGCEHAGRRRPQPRSRSTA